MKSILLFLLLGFFAITLQSQKVKLKDGVVTKDGTPFCLIQRDYDAGFYYYTVKTLKGTEIGYSYTHPYNNSFQVFKFTHSGEEYMISYGLGFGKYLAKQFVKNELIDGEVLNNQNITRWTSRRPYVDYPTSMGNPNTQPNNQTNIYIGTGSNRNTNASTPRPQPQNSNHPIPSRARFSHITLDNTQIQQANTVIGSWTKLNSQPGDDYHHALVFYYTDGQVAATAFFTTLNDKKAQIHLQDANQWYDQELQWMVDTQQVKEIAKLLVDWNVL